MTKRRLPRSDMSDAEERNAAKVARSVTKGQLLSPTSYWVSPKAEFDQAKQDELLGILRRIRPKPERSAEQDLIQRTQRAVIDFEAAREADRKTQGPGEDLLRQLGEASERFAKAWSNVSSHTRLSGIFADHLRGSRRLGPPDDCREGEPADDRQRRKVDEIFARRERVARIEKVATDDLWWLIGDLRPLFSALSSVGGSRNGSEYRCADRIAKAWAETIGLVPTISRNEAGSTPFHRFVLAAVPRPPIGSGILRNVVEATNWGVRSTNSRLK
jgi:hypothetical protein